MKRMFALFASFFAVTLVVILLSSSRLNACNECDGSGPIAQCMVATWTGWDSCSIEDEETCEVSGPGCDETPE